MKKRRPLELIVNTKLRSSLLSYRSAVLFLCFLFFASFAYSQQASLSSPIDPSKYPIQQEIGFMIGPGVDFQSGSFYSSCPCEFEGGSGFGFTFGPNYERDVFAATKFGAALLFDFSAISASYVEIEDIEARSQTSDYSEVIPISIENTADATFFSVGLMPYLKWEPVNFFFVRGGLRVSYLATSNLKHTQTLLQNTVVLSNKEIGVVKLLDETGNPAPDNELVIEDVDFPDINPLQMSLVPAVGFNARLSERLFLSPSVSYSFPLTNLSEQGENFKTSSIRFFLEMRYAFKLRTEKD